MRCSILCPGIYSHGHTWPIFYLTTMAAIARTHRGGTRQEQHSPIHFLVCSCITKSSTISACLVLDACLIARHTSRPQAQTFSLEVRPFLPCVVSLTCTFTSKIFYTILPPFHSTRPSVECRLTVPAHLDAAQQALLPFTEPTRSIGVF